MKRASSWLAGLVAAALSALAVAQAPVEISFYYPVAVGGPITKIVDGLVADFEKENPGIKVKPIYAGSYQQSLAKALTAVKGGDAPTTVNSPQVVPFVAQGPGFAHDLEMKQVRSHGVPVNLARPAVKVGGSRAEVHDQCGSNPRALIFGEEKGSPMDRRK